MEEVLEPDSFLMLATSLMGFQYKRSKKNYCKKHDGKDDIPSCWKDKRNKDINSQAR